jgi:hypothetical protein
MMVDGRSCTQFTTVRRGPRRWRTSSSLGPSVLLDLRRSQEQRRLMFPLPNLAKPNQTGQQQNVSSCLEQLTTGSPTIQSPVPNSSSTRRQPSDVLVPLTAPSTVLGLTTYYEVTKAREVDKILMEASISKDPAAGTLRQDKVCPQKAYRELTADTEEELTVDTRIDKMELFSQCKCDRFSLRSSSVTLLSCS